MADFTTATAEARITAKVADKTWIMGHVARATTGGKIVVRVQRPMSSTSDATRSAGGWVEIDSDAAV